LFEEEKEEKEEKESIKRKKERKKKKKKSFLLCFALISSTRIDLNSSSPPPPMTTTAAAKTGTPAERAKQCPSFRVLPLDGKKSLIATYETAEKLQTRFRQLTKCPTFRFEFDGSNLGTKIHPQLEKSKRERGHDVNAVSERIALWQGYILGWMADETHTQILEPLVRDLESFCFDDLNREALLEVIDGIVFRHAPQALDCVSHWELSNRTLSWVFNLHSTATEDGMNVYPSCGISTILQLVASSGSRSLGSTWIPNHRRLEFPRAAYSTSSSY